MDYLSDRWSLQRPAGYPVVVDLPEPSALQHASLHAVLPFAGVRRCAKKKHSSTLVGILLGIVFLLLTGPAMAEEAALWKNLRTEGHFILVRHALAPGTGDPATFTLGDCATQRNLSDEGRAQATRIGERFRANGIETARVMSSQWCRCLDTAHALGLGPVEELPLANSFFRQPDRAKQQTQALNAWLASQDLGRVTVLVTHQVNITALTGIYPSSGELVFIHIDRGGEVTVLGTLEID